MPPITERGFIMVVMDSSSGYTAMGTTITEDFAVMPGLISIQTGLSRVAAQQATIGIVEFSIAGDRQTVRFNNHPEWEPWVMRRIASYTIGGHAQGGVMKGWWTINAWS